CYKMEILVFICSYGSVILPSNYLSASNGRRAIGGVLSKKAVNPADSQNVHGKMNLQWNALTVSPLSVRLCTTPAQCVNLYSAAISLVFCIQILIRLEFTPLVLFHALLVSIVPSRPRPYKAPRVLTVLPGVGVETQPRRRRSLGAGTSAAGK
ncbi:MAG: hypothetical protein LBH86_00520, partial [Oscillospiraceae bacterium]|nr:hypothetical protein [Oscillospiraceae bacterium]